MSWFNTDRVAVLLSAIAVVWSLVGWWTNRKVAERSTRAQESIANSLAARTASVEAGLANVEPDEAPNWQILPPDDGPWYQLVNLGGTAYDVAVSGTAFERSGPPAHRSVWRRGEGESFLGVDRFGQAHGTVEASFRVSAEGDCLVWSSSLPPRTA